MNPGGTEFKKQHCWQLDDIENKTLLVVFQHAYKKKKKRQKQIPVRGAGQIKKEILFDDSILFIKIVFKQSCKDNDK